MAPKLPSLPPDRAFVHVCNDHRWLARAADNWARLATPNAEQACFAGALDRFLPDVRVAIQSSALHYARSLIEFYVPKKEKPEDIRISDFDTAVSSATASELWKYKAAIDVHLLHLTAWRDADYRVKYRDWGKGRSYGEVRQRWDWDEEIATIARVITAACAEAAENATLWKPPFSRLAEAVRNGVRGAEGWPSELSELQVVERYLAELGLREAGQGMVRI